MKQEQFIWEKYPNSEKYIFDLLHSAEESLPFLKEFKSKLLLNCSSKLINWIDHFIIFGGKEIESDLNSIGFSQLDVACEKDSKVFQHPGAIFPQVVVKNITGVTSGKLTGVAIPVESIADFLAAHNLTGRIEGTPLGPYRRVKISEKNDCSLFVVARRGSRGFVPSEMIGEYTVEYIHSYERWLNRQRIFSDEQVGMESTVKLANELVREMGVNSAAWIAFSAERTYWQQRNRCGRIQKQRQDQPGLGWANVDHHTFRSSRAVFHLLLEILTIFGFKPREKFYAGAEAGWGAQVLEQPDCNLVVFADVDLDPEEIENDFLSKPLPVKKELGTVGLWCALHGESILKAGLHHIAVLSDFNHLIEDLGRENCKFMPPFSNFNHLKQAFSVGENWKILPEKLTTLQNSGTLNRTEVETFGREGVIGSHFENIERQEGFKGFNQQSVSDIIKRTDPRKK